MHDRLGGCQAGNGLGSLRLDLRYGAMMGNPEVDPQIVTSRHPQAGAQRGVLFEQFEHPHLVVEGHGRHPGALHRPVAQFGSHITAHEDLATRQHLLQVSMQGTGGHIELTCQIAGTGATVLGEQRHELLIELVIGQGPQFSSLMRLGTFGFGEVQPVDPPRFSTDRHRSHHGTARVVHPGNAADPVDDEIGEGGQVGSDDGENEVTTPGRLIDGDHHGVGTQGGDGTGQGLGSAVHLNDGREVAVKIGERRHPHQPLIGQSLPSVGCRRR